MSDRTKPASRTMSEITIEEIREVLSKVPERPWFYSGDDAGDCGPHRQSGLALVDTGRESDWPIARLCEWPQARFIARAPEYIDFLLAEVDRTQSAQDACFRKLTETIAEVDRLKAERERDETCIVCSALLLTDNSEPPHCVNCQVTDEDRERWEDGV